MAATLSSINRRAPQWLLAVDTNCDPRNADVTSDDRRQTGPVLVSFRRLSRDGLHSIRIARDDGVVMAIESNNRKGFIPHDMVHFVGERSFSIEDGFWGSIANGALFESVRVVEGKLRHDAQQRSRAVLKANAAGLLLGEVIGGPCYRAVEHGLDLDTAYKNLVRTWGSVRTTRMPYSRETLKAAIEAFADARDRWRAVPVGDELSMVWKVKQRRR